MEERTIDQWKDLLFELVRSNFTMMDDISRPQKAALGILFREYDDMFDVCSMFAANSVDWFRRKSIGLLFNKEGTSALDMAEASALINCIGTKDSLGHFQLSDDGLLLLGAVVEELKREYPSQELLPLSPEFEGE
jgi:hypothetical protein